MKPLVWKASLRFYRQNIFYLCLILIGIATGTAAITSSQIAIDSSLRSFELQSSYLQGQATHEVRAVAGRLPLSLFKDLKTKTNLVFARPVMRENINLGNTLWKIVGIDPFAELVLRPYLFNAVSSGFRPLDLMMQKGAAIAFSESLEEKNQSALEAALKSEGIPVNVMEVIRPEKGSVEQALNQYIILDINYFLQLFPDRGIDSIQLKLSSEKQFLALQQFLTSHYSEQKLQINELKAQNQSTMNLSRSFQLNLKALSFLTILVGVFILYNTLNFLVLKRRAYFGLLRCMGISGNETLQIVIKETLLISMAGSAIGVLAGMSLSGYLIDQVTGIINDHYFSVQVNAKSYDFVTMLSYFALGTLTSLVSAVIPAWEASRIPPAHQLIRSIPFRVQLKKEWMLSLIGFLLLAAGYLIVSVTHTSLVWLFGGVFLQIIGLSLAIPLSLRMLLLLTEKLKPVSGKILFRLSVSLLGHASSRVFILTIAVVIAVATAISVETMISSFRMTLTQWLEKSLQGEIYISLKNKGATFQLSDLLDSNVNLAEGTRYNYIFNRDIETKTGVRKLLVVHSDSNSLEHGFQFIEQERQGGLEPNVIISEPMAYKTGLKTGDTLRLDSAKGEVLFRIRGVFYDYANEKGLIAMDWNTYSEFWSEPEILSMSFNNDLKDAVWKAQLYDLVKRKPEFQITTKEEMLSNALFIFDRTFQVVSVLKLIAALVAFAGAVSAFFLLQMEGKRTLSQLFILGVKPNQLAGFTLYQAVILGVYSAVLSWIPGIWMSWLLVDAVNKKSFGWTLQWELEPQLLLNALMVTLAASLTASIVPSLYMKKEITNARLTND